MNIIEIAKTDSISGSRIILNTNFKTLQDNIDDIDNFFYTPEDSSKRTAVQLPADSWLDANEIRTNKIKAKSTLRFTIPNKNGEITFFAVNTDNGHILILDNKDELVLDVNAALYAASTGNVDIQGVVNKLLKDDSFMTAVTNKITTTVLTPDFINNNIVPLVTQNNSFTAAINRAVSGSIQTALEAFLDSSKFKDKVDSIIDEHVMPTPTKYTVIANVNDSTMGKVSPTSKEVEAGKSLTLTATAFTGYKFVNWNTGQTSNKITITVNDNMELVANFAEIQQQQYTVSAYITPKESGKITGIPGGLVDENTTIGLIAMPEEGYSFLYWLINGEKFTSFKQTYTIVSNTEIIAVFEKSSNANKFSIEFAEGGSKYYFYNEETKTKVDFGESSIIINRDIISSKFGITDATKFVLIYTNNENKQIEITKDGYFIHYYDSTPKLNIKASNIERQEVEYKITDDIDPVIGGEL